MLPKIKTPIFNLTLPISKTEIKYRPFTVKEEKILLLGKQTKDPIQIGLSISQIVQNCIINDVDIDNLPSFEVDFLFLKLRTVSVNNIIEIKLQDQEDEQYYDIKIDLEDIRFNSENSHPGTFKLDEQFTVKLKYPTFGDMKKVVGDNVSELTFNIIGKTIDVIYDEKDENNVHIFKDYSEKDRDEFLDSLSSKNLNEIQEFIAGIPQIKHTIKYKREDGKEIQKELNGLLDFFTFA